MADAERVPTLGMFEAVALRISLLARATVGKMSKLSRSVERWCVKCGEDHRPTPAIDGSVDEDGEPACAAHQVHSNRLESATASSQPDISSRIPGALALGSEAEISHSKLFQEDHVSRRCKVDGCKEILKNSNISGFCRIHRPHTEVRSAQNTHTLSEKRPTTHASDEFVAERVTAFLTGLPITDQRRLVGAWLAGRI
jgi:hypothetical protein